MKVPTVYFSILVLTLLLNSNIVSANESDIDNNQLISPTGVHFELPKETWAAERSLWARVKKYVPIISFNCFVTTGIKLKWGGYAFENKIGFDEKKYMFMTNVARNNESFWTIVNLSPTGEYSVQMQVRTKHGPGYYIYNLKPDEVSHKFLMFYKAAKSAQESYTSKLLETAGLLKKQRPSAGGVLLLSKFIGFLKKPAKIENGAINKENAEEIKSVEKKLPEEAIAKHSSSNNTFETASQGSFEKSNEKEFSANEQPNLNYINRIKKGRKDNNVKLEKENLLTKKCKKNTCCDQPKHYRDQKFAN